MGTSTTRNLGLVFGVLLWIAGCGGPTTTVSGPSPSRCQIAVTSTIPSIGAAGGTGTLNVTTARECTWSASSETSWITITSGSSGQGDGTVQYAVAANPDAAPRRGGLAVSGQRVDISQEGSPCRFAVSPPSETIGQVGGTRTVSVSTVGGCAWTAASHDEWITITAGESGTGTGGVSFVVAANSGGARTGSLTIGGQTVTVTQVAGGSACSYAITPASQAIAAGGETGAVDVAAGAGCAWTATANDPWITITSGAAGSGSGRVSFTVPAQTGATRTGTLTVAGQTFTVTQAAPGCSYVVTPRTFSITAGGGSGTIFVEAAAPGCAWIATSSASWISIAAGASGTGNGSVTFVVGANNGAARPGSLTVAGHPVTVTQAAAPCIYTLTPPSGLTIGFGGGPGLVAVATRSGCAWTATTTDTWIRITGGATGDGNGTVTFTVDQLSGPTRTGTIRIAGLNFTVTQTAPACTYSLAPTSQAVVAGEATHTVNVTTAAFCAWTVSLPPSWITITAPPGRSATGSGPVIYVVAANSGPERAATLTIAGVPFTVTQAGGCTYSVAPLTPPQFPAAEGSGSVTVTTAAGCPWTAATTFPWIINVTPPSGSGNGTVNYTVQANTGPPRTGTLMVVGQTVTVTQASGCTYTIGPNPPQFGANGGTSTVPVTTGATCPWSATSPELWVRITAGSSGIGNGNVSYVVDQNPGGGRQATLTIATRPFTVAQCGYSLTASSAVFTRAAGSGFVDVRAPAGCSWTARSDVAWITTTSTGTGDGRVNFNVLAFLGPGERTGTLRIGGATGPTQTFTVTQRF